MCASTAGLGLAGAVALAEEGAPVVTNGRDEERLRAAAERLGAVARGDVSTTGQRSNVQLQTSAALGEPHIT